MRFIAKFINPLLLLRAMGKEMYYYKCPVCNMSQYAENFIKYEFGAKEPLDLGYLQVRFNYGGRKGIRRISYEALVKSIGQTAIADEILERLRHSILAMIHALHKQELIKDVDLPLTLQSKEYSDLVYKYDNALVLIKKYKKYIEQLTYETDNLKNNNSELIMVNDNLQHQNQQLNQAIENSAYANY